ncbi:MAG: nucleotidyltransferase domain-containing protein [Candidatus Symbiothrix sp.]|jgi:predicted nucleotidyltransferase|nr:nucleotidyltransferase domain-containing protein [Candidatus Symbiothrix sp.]
MDKREDIIDKVRTYKSLVEKTFPMKIEKVYLFGSYAKGTPREHSDIDVAFVISHFEGNYLKIIPPIWKLTRKVDFRIEPHVIARDTDYAGFLDEIKRTGVEIA